ncbi:MAG TPA: alkaline shock response membrane anchor protein AmaP [Clostridiales bacterium]|nr:alkaline shock response membrane anchor protein AmaP [Clostridiales bacterium]
MKIKVFDRILLTLVSLLVMFESLVLLGIALNILPVVQLVQDFISDASKGWSPFVLAAVSILFLVAAFRLLVAGYTNRKPNSTIMGNTELGVIRISVNTLDTLTQKAVRSFNEVREVKSIVLPDADGVKVQLKLTVQPDVVMPDLSKNIQNKVKEYVESLSGIVVREVQIYIENLSIAKQARVE